MIECTEKTSLPKAHHGDPERRPLRHLAGAVCFAAALSSAACASSKPPPRPAEVPIEQFAGAPPPAAEPNSPPPAPEVAPVEAVAPAGAATGPVATPLPQTAEATPPAASRGRPPLTQHLKASECGKILDRYVLLTELAKGRGQPQGAHANASARAAIESDPVYTGAQSACPDQYSKKQYSCAVVARTTDAWKKCLE